MTKVSFRVILIAFAALNANFLLAQTGMIESWITNPDRSALFEKQPENISFSERI